MMLVTKQNIAYVCILLALAAIGMVVYQQPIPVIHNTTLTELTSDRTYNVSLPHKEKTSIGAREVPYQLNGIINHTTNTWSVRNIRIIVNGCTKALYVKNRRSYNIPIDVYKKELRCDEARGFVVDLTPYLRKGDNHITIDFTHYGGDVLVNIQPVYISSLAVQVGVGLLAIGLFLLIAQHLSIPLGIFGRLGLLSGVLISIMIMLMYIFAPVHKLKGVVERKAIHHDYLIQMGMQSENFVPFEDIPKNMIIQLLRLEDGSFFSHPGYDVVAIARSMQRNLYHEQILSGGSTITMQLVKNAFLSPEKSFLRKLKEVFYAQKLEQKYSKEEIIALYLSTVELGIHIFGIKDAAEAYFGKTPSELTDIESAYMISLIASPYKCSRWAFLGTHDERCKYRMARALEFTNAANETLGNKDVAKHMSKRDYIVQALNHVNPTNINISDRDVEFFFMMQPPLLLSYRDLTSARTENINTTPIAFEYNSTETNLHLFHDKLPTADMDIANIATWRADRFPLIYMKEWRYKTLAQMHGTFEGTSKLMLINDAPNKLIFYFDKNDPLPMLWKDPNCLNCINLYPVYYPGNACADIELNTTANGEHLKVTLDKTFEPLQKIKVHYEGNRIEVSYEPSTKPYRILIDSGHGGVDHGARKGDYMEKDINMEASRILRDVLNARGFEAELLSENDIYDTLSDRFHAANNTDYDLFVSMHHDNFNHGNRRPACIFSRDDLLGLCIGVSKIMKDLGIEKAWPRRAMYMVTRPTQIPSVLVELLNMNDEEEFKRIRNKDERSKYYHQFARKFADLLEESMPGQNIN